MGIKDTSKSLAATLRLDSHHAIERFGVVFLLVVITFVLLFGGATTSSLANQRENLDSTTLYTPSFTTSKTQQAGEVPGVFINSDRTRALLLMHFRDPETMSSNAENYQAYLTGSATDLSDQPLKTAITGQIVVFGSTGYMGMVLDSAAPFEQQIVNLTMRANAELVYKPSDKRKIREDLVGQATFVEYDQWRLYFNPGAKGAQVTTALDAPAFDATAVYDELVIRSEEESLRTKMDDQLAQMRIDTQKIDEFTAEAMRVDVDGAFLVIPESPTQIDGDKIIGSPAVGDEASTLALETEWVAPGGFDFDWRAGSVGDGYLDDLVPEDASYVTWLADKAMERRSGSSDALRAQDIEWKLSSGLDLKNFSSDDTTMRPLLSVRNGLAQAYQDLYKHKVEYQRDSLAALLELEIQLRNVDRSASTFAGDKALFTY